MILSNIYNSMRWTWVCPKTQQIVYFWQRSYLLCFCFVLKLPIFKQSRWPIKRRTHFLSDSYSAGEVSRIRQLSLFQESENWIWVCEGNINIWPVQNGELAWQKKVPFFPRNIHSEFVYKCRHPEASVGKWKVQTFDAMPFLLCRPFPWQPLSGVKQIYAQHIYGKICQMCRMWTKNPNMYTNIARITKAVNCHSLLSWHLH